MTQPIRGKVARVLNTREIAINIGAAHGVGVGMYFDVMDASETDIVDPDTQELLGILERPKVRVRVTHAQEKLSVATTHRARGVNTDSLAALTILTIPTFGPIARTLMPPNWVTRYETLKKTERTDDRKPDENGSYVNIGDPVVQVIEETE